MKIFSDITYLRKNHRIVGTFIGSLPERTQQNDDLGLPLLLMPEEAKLLVENGIAVIIKYDMNFEEMKEFYDKLKTEFVEEYSKQFKAERTQTILNMSEKIVAGKIDKFLEKNVGMDPKQAEEEIIRAEISKIPEITADTCATKIYTNCPFDKRSETVIEFKYPKTERQLIRYRVFRDLWNKNYYITDGIKFGADFLVYEMNPIVIHSKFMVICREEQQLDDLEIQAYGRLGKSVRKNVLIAFVGHSERNDYQIEYKTIEWQNKLN